MRDRLNNSAEFEFLKVNSKGVESEITRLAKEVPFTISANGQELATLMSSPLDLKELTYGFLYTSRFISSVKDVQSFELDEENLIGNAVLAKAPKMESAGKKVFTSGCGQGVIYYTSNDLPDTIPMDYSLLIEKEVIFEIMREFQSVTKSGKKVRGLHTSAIMYKDKRDKCFIDDVGRHNAVDKVIGYMLLSGGIFNESILITSGRVSSEIIHKAVRCGIQLVVSLGSCTHHGILLAKNMNITLIGLARSGSFSIFTGKERVKL